MKRSIITLSAVAATTFVGPFANAEEASEPDAFLGITPTLDFRTRYEFREVDGSDPSHALTARARVGLQTGVYNGFSAFGELEQTYALVDDYDAGPGGNPPTVPGNTAIGDPENTELNRAWIKYENSGFTFKAGRQRIKTNNDAFIGNVGWRQNEQTFDALTFGYKANGMNLSYTYSNSVKRIFGNDAGGAAEKFDGDFHFLDGSIEVNDGKLGGYAYLIDVDNNAAVGESNTFGLFYEGGGLHAEIAWQDGTSSIASGTDTDYDAIYGHLKYSKKAGGATYGIGLEYLEEDFKTPFATVHAFNGFADAFILQRIGLNKANGYEGLADIYLSYVRSGLPGGITFKGFLHYMMDDGFGDTYGYEADAVLVKKLGDNTTAILKAAYFMEDDGPGNFEDIKQVTLGLNYKF